MSDHKWLNSEELTKAKERAGRSITYFRDNCYPPCASDVDVLRLLADLDEAKAVLRECAYVLDGYDMAWELRRAASLLARIRSIPGVGVKP